MSEGNGLPGCCYSYNCLGWIFTAPLSPFCIQSLGSCSHERRAERRIWALAATSQAASRERESWQQGGMGSLHVWGKELRMCRDPWQGRDTHLGHLLPLCPFGTHGPWRILPLSPARLCPQLPVCPSHLRLFLWPGLWKMPEMVSPCQPGIVPSCFLTGAVRTRMVCKGRGAAG